MKRLGAVLGAEASALDRALADLGGTSRPGRGLLRLCRWLSLGLAGLGLRRRPGLRRLVLVRRLLVALAGRACLLRWGTWRSGDGRPGRRKLRRL